MNATQQSNLEPSSTERASTGEGAETPLLKPEPAISVAESAAKAIKRQLDKRGTPESSLRVGIRGGGCSGFSYVIEFHDGPPRPRDRVFDAFGVRVVVDPKSLIYLNGTELQWEQTLMQQGFKFVNPNEKTSCGCGHSFTV